MNTHIRPSSLQAFNSFDCSKSLPFPFCYVNVTKPRFASRHPDSIITVVDFSSKGGTEPAIIVWLSSARRLSDYAYCQEEGTHAARQNFHPFHGEESRLRRGSYEGCAGSEPLHLPGMQSLFIHAFPREDRPTRR